MMDSEWRRADLELSGWWLVLGAVVGGGLVDRRNHNQRTTTKFFQSLVIVSQDELSKINYSALPREAMHSRGNQAPIQRLDVNDPAYNVVAFVGERRSGKTIFLANSILYDMFPWWFRVVCPPRGLYLTGTQYCKTIDAWLKSQIPTTSEAKENPWATVVHQLRKRREEQRVRRFLFSVFRTHWPVLLRPQPAIIVIDQAEQLLQSYRASFLVRLNDELLEEGSGTLFRLVLVVESENAVQALRQMDHQVTAIQAPKVTREAVAAFYGEEAMRIYDDCDCCIGIAVDYMHEKRLGEVLTAKDYAAKLKPGLSLMCLQDEISHEEFIAARERLQKQQKKW